MEFKSEKIFEASRKESIDLSGHDFLDILESNKFLTALSTAGGKTHKSGHETGFKAIITKDKQLIIPSVKKGTTDEMDNSSEFRVIDQHTGILEQAESEIVNLHFHPGTDGSIQPTKRDLNILLNSPELKFMCVAQIRENKDIDILFVSRSKKIILPEELNDYESNLASAYSAQEDIIELLREYGFESFIVNLNKHDKNYKLDDVSKNRIENILSIKINF